MRRTYRSKKDTGGGLDHRDVLLSVDEKSSAFDAFYIQNLKQTKRELSSMGSSAQCNAITKKIRKKKFVKRIVKEVETAPRDSMSRSTYLTPDKSIRVNKGQDLFDLLLNTTTPQHVEPKVAKMDTFDIVRSGREPKTYGTRKARKVKKINYCSSDSYETDKENEDNNISKNATDIRTHKLILEKDVSNGPKHQDESINNVVQNLSLLNNLRNSNSSNSPIISFTYSKKRTKQLQSTVIDKSVLSSTPFKNIRTATSIYKFSPISRISYGESPNYVPITEENDAKVPLIDLKSASASHGRDTNPIKECNDKESNDSISVNANNVEAFDASHVSNIENEKCEEDNDVSVDRNEDIATKKSVTDDLDCISVLSDGINESDWKISLGGSKPSEPFLGFTVISNENDVLNADKLQDSINTSIPEVIEVVNDSELVVALGGSKPSKLFFGFSAIDNDLNASLDNNSQILEDANETTTGNSSVNSQDVESLYDTCSSDKYAEIAKEINKEPIIKVTKLDDAVFQKYYEKIAAYASDTSGNEDMDEESEENDASNKTSLNLEVQTNNDEIIEKVEYDSDDYSNPDLNAISDLDNSNIEADTETVSPQSSESEFEGSMSKDLESNSSDDEEVRCFVNTRRRVTIKKNSKELSFNNSSSASSECDKTVLSNNKLIINSSNVKEISPNETLVSDEDAKPRNSLHGNSIKAVDTITLDSDEIEEKITHARVSFVKTRKSRKNSALPKSPINSLDTKPAIVLQPGKKWERSLSIYRRMTMMNDHFDRSMLEDASLLGKGRKYRQSVLSTMEMQESSLHNESISSRRSTFVAKPCRSTIKILKEPNNSRISLCNSSVYDDLKGFLSDDCDDTIVELSKLSIADTDHESTVVEKVHGDRLTTARDYVLRRCNQSDAILFDECYPDPILKNCHKIGEGVYGEVFLWRARDGRARVMKIIPVAGSTKVNGENQKDFHEIISEIVIAMELSAIRTPIADLERQFDEGKEVDALELHAIQNATDVFNEVLAVRCVYGSYTSRLLDLWELYDECKGSENDNPAILPRDQQFIVLELANAGQDLESYQFNSAEQAHALFLQVAFGLAVGEEAFQFEHRDLHWGNVLIAPTEQKFATFVLRGRSHRVPRCGVAATIIDYSLSRLSLPLSAAGGEGAAAALYNDLATDDALFDAVGDYQFQVYRLMRDKLGNDWKNFEPYTNILWLHYTVDKMITALRYKRTNTKIHKHYISKLKAIKNRILSYGSAVQFVLTDIEY